MHTLISDEIIRAIYTVLLIQVLPSIATYCQTKRSRKISSIHEGVSINCNDPKTF